MDVFVTLSVFSPFPGLATVAACRCCSRVKDEVIRETETQGGTGTVLLTARLEAMSSLTSLLVTSHSRCRIGRGRTLCVGCAQGTWHEAPAQRKSWPEGPAGSDLGKGHFPHRSYKRKEGQSGHLRTAEDSLHTERISRRRALRARLFWQSITDGCNPSHFDGRKLNSTNFTQYPGLLLINSSK